MNSWLHWGPAAWLVVDALAVYRLSRLVARDEIVAPLRRRLDAEWQGPLVYFVTCIWCLSIWIAAGVVALTCFWAYAWSFPASGLAMSAVAGFVGERE